MERIARQNLECELQRTFEKLSASTSLCDGLQQTELAYHHYAISVCFCVCINLFIYRNIYALYFPVIWIC